MVDSADILVQLQAIGQQFDTKECLPNRAKILRLLQTTQALLFPRFFSFHQRKEEACLRYLQQHLSEQICAAHHFSCHKDCPNAQLLAQRFLMQLPQIKHLLLSDIEAMYQGDPAAHSPEEIILCYPGFYAIMVHRIAHALYQLDVAYLPRIMSEYAHTQTGIDIHPGANIGAYFCIDHGTGIVIGETSVIGHHVKIYQGVTIGAKSFDLDENGHPVKGGKRHPNIGNHVIIYAGATILGADTYVGEGAIIGGNVWLTHSVPPGEKIYYMAP